MSLIKDCGGELEHLACETESTSTSTIDKEEEEEEEGSADREGSLNGASVRPSSPVASPESLADTSSMTKAPCKWACGYSTVKKAVDIIRRLKVFSNQTLLSFLATVFLQAGYVGSQRKADFIIYFQLTVLVHELGHAAVMLALGIEFYPITFLPYEGAFVKRKTYSQSVYDEALIAAGGPLAGTLCALWIIVVAYSYKSKFLLLLGVYAAKNNQYNMDGWGVLDGARMISVISPFLSLAASACFVVFKRTDITERQVAMLLMGVAEQLSRLAGDTNKLGNGGPCETYFNVSITQRLFLGFSYILLWFTSHDCLQVSRSPSEAASAAIAWTIICGLFWNYIMRTANRRVTEKATPQQDVDSEELNRDIEMELDESIFHDCIEDHEATGDDLQSDCLLKTKTE